VCAPVADEALNFLEVGAVLDRRVQDLAEGRVRRVDHHLARALDGAALAIAVADDARLCGDGHGWRSWVTVTG
jgi:hypothetical protein